MNGRLKIVAVDGDSGTWRCECSCGKEVFVNPVNMETVRSCGCIVVLGLDAASSTGWAVRYSWRSPAAIKCGVFNVGQNDDGSDVSWETKYALTANAVYKLIKEHQPDFVVIEEPQHRVAEFAKIRVNPQTGKQETTRTVNPAALQLTGIAAAAIGVCTNMKVPCGTIGASTWHAKYHGKGNKPGEKQDWKDVAIKACEREKIPLPTRKKDQKDAAEAVCISACWHWCNVIEIKWMQTRFMQLRTDAVKALAQRKSAVNLSRENVDG